MRIAVFGCGSIGRRHVRNLVALGRGAPNVLVYDADLTQSASLAAETGVASAETIEAVWDWRPSVAVIATPSFLHVPLAAAAAEQKCDLFVEKPLGHSLDGIAELLAEARRQSLVTLVGCNMRFHPGPATVKQMIDTGAIGSVLSARIQTGSYLPAWRPGADYRAGYSARTDQGGGAILDCIHELDLALWYLGPARLAGRAVRPATVLGLEVDGLAEILLEHDGGAVSSVHLNFIQRDYRRSCQVIGTTGTIYWDFETPRVTIHRGDSVETSSLPSDWSINDMYVDELRHFLACVEGRQPTTAPLEQGASALALALAVRGDTDGDPVNTAKAGAVNTTGPTEAAPDITGIRES